MDEILATPAEETQPPAGLSREEYEERLADLANARKWLFDDDWVRERVRQTREYSQEQAKATQNESIRRFFETPLQGIDATGLFDQRTRARNAFNNIGYVVPGKGGKLGDDNMLDLATSRTAGDFRREFREIATELGIDINKVEELHGEPSGIPPEPGEEDNEFKLDRFIYPIVEKMVKERGWPAIYG